MNFLFITTTQNRTSPKCKLPVLLDSIRHALTNVPDIRVKVVCVSQLDSDSTYIREEMPRCSIEIVGNKSSLSLSAARNLALRHMKQSNEELSSYDLVGFPDDDCAYGAETLLILKDYAERRCIAILKHGAEAIGTADHAKIRLDRAVKITSSNVMFFCGRIATNDDLFSEHYGLGGHLGSGEDVDYLIRVWRREVPELISVDFAVIHPRKKGRQERYYRGNVALLKANVDLPGFRYLLCRQLAVGVMLVAQRRLKGDDFVKSWQ